MIVQIEKQQPPRPSRLINNRTCLRSFNGAVLKKRSYLGQRQRWIADRQQVKRRANAMLLQPNQHCRQQQQMHQPHRQRAQFTGGNRFQRINPRRDDIQRRTEHNPPAKRIAHLGQQRKQSGITLPLCLTEIITFGIFMRVGQMFIAVMLDMRIAIQPIGIPHRQRQQAKELIDAGPPRRMAVDQLMLQRHIPGGQQNQQRRAKPGSQRLPVVHHAKPAAVHRRHDAPGRQLASPIPALVKLLDPKALCRMQIVAVAFG
ncbi:hypothetical protein D3C81_246280 [compost metagenome]